MGNGIIGSSFKVSLKGYFTLKQVIIFTAIALIVGIGIGFLIWGL